MEQPEYFLDETPGEARGVVMRGGEYEALYIERHTDLAVHRLGTRLVGRVARVEPGLKAAFIDLGEGALSGFLALPKSPRLDVGAKVEVVVSAEPRESKGPALKLVGLASGDVRVLQPGATVREIMTNLAGGQPVTGLPAIRAALEAGEAAMSGTLSRPEVGLDLAVERTRALIAVDIDYAPLPGKDSRRAREAVNRTGLLEAARLIGLKGWGGVVAIDLAGVHLHAETVNQWARQAFGGRENVAFGPLSRFGTLQLSLPWGRRPVDEVLGAPQTRYLDALRQLNLAIHEDRSQPVWALECDPLYERVLAPLVAELGPRARLSPTTAGAVFRVTKG